MPSADPTDRQLDVLHEVDKSGGRAVGYASVASGLNISKTAVKNHLEKLEDKDLVELEPDPEGTLILLTSAAQQYLREDRNRVPQGGLRAPSREPDGGEKGEKGVNPGVDAIRKTQRRPTARSHFVSVVCEVVNREDLPKSWRSKWVEKNVEEWSRNEATDTYTIFQDGFNVRFSREAVTVVVKNGARGSSVPRAVNDMMEGVGEAVDWVRQHTPVEVRMGTLNVSTHHVALMGHYVAAYVDAREDLELEELVVVDEETGEERIVADCSEGVPELEAIQAETAEDDARFLQEDVAWRVHNKEDARRLRDLPEEVDGLERRIGQLTETVRQFVKSVEADRLGGRPRADPRPGSRQLGPRVSGSGTGVVADGQRLEANGHRQANGTDEGEYYDDEIEEALDRLDKWADQEGGTGA